MRARALLLNACLVAAVACSTAPPLNCQTAPTTALAYDVIVVKKSHAQTFSQRMSMQDTTLQTTNMNIKSIMTAAYGVREGLISGLPSWAESARYDINAKVVDPDPKVFNNMTREQRRALVVSLLADRFHLKVHIETRTLPVYDMVLTKDGPKFKESPPLAADDPSNRAHVNTTRRSFDSGYAGMLDFTSRLAEVVDRTIIDKTGLTGEYDLHLKYTPNDAAASDAPDAPPDLFTALQEQLGLKLIPSRGPVETLVVDHIEQPTEN